MSKACACIIQMLWSSYNHYYPEKNTVWHWILLILHQSVTFNLQWPFMQLMWILLWQVSHVCLHSLTNREMSFMKFWLLFRMSINCWQNHYLIIGFLFFSYWTIWDLYEWKFRSWCNIWHIVLSRISSAVAWWWAECFGLTRTAFVTCSVFWENRLFALYQFLEISAST